jgi:hypothetical protein
MRWRKVKWWRGRRAVRYELSVQDFKHIKAWQRAHALAIELHKSTRHFSRVNAGTLRRQLTDAADSVAATIVEGCGAATNPELGLSEFLCVRFVS